MRQVLISLARDRIDSLLADTADANEIEKMARALDWPMLDLGEEWAVVHNLISGDFPIPRERAQSLGLSFDDEGWEAILMGGSSLGAATEFGAIHWHSAEFVARAARRLATLDLALIRDLWDAEYFNENHFGNRRWSESEDEVSEVVETIERLISFYREAAARGDCVVSYVV